MAVQMLQVQRVAAVLLLFTAVGQQTSAMEARMASGTLVMKLKAGSTKFHYDSAYWTNMETVDEGTHGVAPNEADLGDDADTKLPAFMDTPLQRFKLCWENLQNCYTYDLGASYTSAQEVFATDGYIPSSNLGGGDISATDAKRQWTDLFLPPSDPAYDTFWDGGSGTSCGMQSPGINAVCQDNNNARIGYCVNVNDQGCHTTGEDSDSSVGIGLRVQEHPSYPKTISNGPFGGYMLNSDPSRFQKQAWLFVEAPTPLPTAEPTQVCSLDKLIVNNPPEAARSYSSVHGGDHDHSMLGSTTYSWAWSAAHNDANQWMEIALGAPTKVRGVVTQGRGNWDEWVKSFEVSVRRAAGGDLVSVGTFTANSDRNTEVYNYFNNKESAEAVRFNVLTWNRWISMRAAVLECGPQEGIVPGFVMEFHTSLVSSDWELESFVSSAPEPTETQDMTSGGFEVTPGDYYNGYIGVIRGQFMANVTGNYTFKVCGDDSTKLWLRLGDGTFHRIAKGVGATGPSYTQQAGQISQPLYLEAGHLYDIVAAFFEVGGGEFVRVAVETPDGLSLDPIPVSMIFFQETASTTATASSTTIAETSATTTTASSITTTKTGTTTTTASSTTITETATTTTTASSTTITETGTSTTMISTTTTVTETTTITTTTTTREPCSAGSYREGDECQPCPVGYHSPAGVERLESCLMTFGTALASLSPPQVNASLQPEDGTVLLTLSVEELPPVYGGIVLSYAVDLATNDSALNHNSNCSRLWTHPSANTLMLTIASRDEPCRFRISESDSEATWSTLIALFVVADTGFVAPPIITPLTLRLMLLHEASSEGGAAWGLQSTLVGEVEEELPTPESALSIHASESYAASLEFPLFIAGDNIFAMHALTSGALDYELSLRLVFLSASSDPNDWSAIRYNLTDEVVISDSSDASQVRFRFIARPCQPFCWLHCASRLTVSSRRLGAAGMVPSTQGRLLSASGDEARGVAVLSIQGAATKHVAFDGDYEEVVGENKTAFLTECSEELAPIRCVDVAPGSIVVTLAVSPDEEDKELLDRAVELVRDGGLDLPSFPTLAVQTTTPGELTTSEGKAGYRASTTHHVGDETTGVPVEPTAMEDETTTEQLAVSSAARSSDKININAVTVGLIATFVALVAVPLGFAVWCVVRKGKLQKQGQWQCRQEDQEAPKSISKEDGLVTEPEFEAPVSPPSSNWQEAPASVLAPKMSDALSVRA